MRKILICLLILSINCAYIPQLMMTASADLINKEISSNYGAIISQKINQYKVSDVNYDDKLDGIHIRMNLTNIKQLVSINWKANILTVKDKHNFMINAKNINLTLDGDLSLKIGLTRKQKGPLKVTITQLEVDVSLAFEGIGCPKSIGFNVQIKDIYVNVNAVKIKIEGHGLDNTIIKYLERIIMPRIPKILSNAIESKINPLVTNYACSRVEERINITDQNYILTVNTTKVPEFDNQKNLGIPIDITFQNQVTNQTNDEIENQNLPNGHIYGPTSDLTLALSSNFLNTVTWLVNDAKILHFTVTNQLIANLTDGDPPILLNTTNLSILMPKLKKWPNKEVFLSISTSTKYEHLLIRNGRLITVLSLSIKFVVDIAGNSSDVKQCTVEQQCIVACDLNMTLPVSLSMNINRNNIFGLIQSANFYDVTIINSLIDVNTKSFKSIINSIIGGMIPQLNSQIQDGQMLPQAIINKMKDQNITEVKSKISSDYIALGFLFDL